MPAHSESWPAVGRSTRPDPDQILRFRKSERQLHWAVAVPFMVSYASALLLVAVYNPYPDRPYRDVISLIHKISGICLILVPLLTILRHRRDFGDHLQNIRQAWRWTWNDVRWLFLMGPAAVNPKIDLPHQGKFNAAEKINFMVLTSTYPLYIVTGLLIWLPSVAILAWFLHFSMAVIATPLLLGHIFMATINPDTRVGLGGMFSGFVDRRWARHHYRLWYDEHYGARVGFRAPTGVPRSNKPRQVPTPRPAPSHGTVWPAREWRPLAGPIPAARLGARPVLPPSAVALLGSHREPPTEPRPEHKAG